MLEFRVGRDVGGGGEAVIRRKNDESVFREAVFLKGGEEEADVGVDLGDEVAVGRGVSFSRKLARRQNRRVWCGEWEVEKEGLAVAGGGAFSKEREGLFDETGLHVFHLKIGPDRAAAPQFGHRAVGDGSRGHGGGAIVGQPHVRRHIEGCADAEEAVEAIGERAVGEGLGEIDVFELSARARPIEAKVPFAEDGGGVAVFAEEARDSGTVRLDERWVVTLQHALFQTSTPCIAAGEERVAGGSTEGGSGVGVRETQASTREAVEVRRSPGALGIVARDVADAEVVGKDVDDVWRRSRGPGGERDKQGPNGSEDHPVTSSAEPPDFFIGSVTYYVTLDFEYFLRKT